MNRKVNTRQILTLALAVIGLAVTASPSFAASYALQAGQATVLVNGINVPVWGFACISTDVSGAACVNTITVPGPRLVVPAGDTTLTITLTNNLTEPVSVVVPGLPAILNPTWINPAVGTITSTGSRAVGDTTSRARSLTAETAPGATTAYTWTNVRPGTFLYHSGSNVAKQVHMGLYGVVTNNAVDAATGIRAQAYPGVEYDAELLLVYSEIDPALHTSAGFANTINYDPRYFLINGQPFAGSTLTAGNVNQSVLVRFVNAGLRSYVPEFQSGYLEVVAEDGNRYTYTDPATNIQYPYARSQYSVLLPAGKTIDAVWTPAQEGTYNLFDRRLHLTNDGTTGGGMLAKLVVSPAALAAADDTYPAVAGAWQEDLGPFSEVAPGVLANDAAGTTATLVSGPGAGILSLDPNGSFTYTPNANFNGTDIFTYKATDGIGLSNVATVKLTVSPVNDAPVAMADTYAASTTVQLSVAAPGVLGNDTDVDGDTLTASIVSGLSGLTLNPDGSFTYLLQSTPGGYSFTYKAVDPSHAESAPVTVTIIVTPAANQPPVAADDFATTKKNVAITIGVIANDTDIDGTIVAGSVAVSGETVISPTQAIAGTPLGGTVVNHRNGTITYTPRNNFKGTDTFTYTVKDNLGATSNLATVRINVTK